jgi:hypothetical protein
MIPEIENAPHEKHYYKAVQAAVSTGRNPTIEKVKMATLKNEQGLDLNYFISNVRSITEKENVIVCRETSLADNISIMNATFAQFFSSAYSQNLVFVHIENVDR